ncbi:unnamed protein product [Ectocarpus sp. CCAP 1310/34]|nr:unnamed protein product [Ectocarpus sp. CCAP 1310/34]
MPQGSSAAPGWFCKVMQEVIINLLSFASYVDDLTVLDGTAASRVGATRALFERLRTHNLKLKSPKATIGATEANVLGFTISPDGVRPNGAKVAALINMPMPKDIKHLRSLLDGLSYHRKFLPNTATHIRPLTTLPKKQVKVLFTPSMEQAVRVLLFELANPPVLVYPDRDAVSDGSRPFHHYSDAHSDGFGRTLNKNGRVAPSDPSFSSTELLWTPNVTGFISISRRVASCSVSNDRVLVGYEISDFSRRQIS